MYDNNKLLPACTFTGEAALVNLTPLAIYTNTLTSMLNELRHCAPAGQYLELGEVLFSLVFLFINYMC